MKKARSRLNLTTTKEEKLEVNPPAVDTSSASNKPESKRKSRRVVSRYKNDNKATHLKHLPTFFLSLIFGSGVYFILTKVDPEIIEDVLLPNSYLPLLLTFLMASFLFFSFLFLSSMRGLLVGLVLTLILFLQLQQVIWEGWLVGGLIIGSIVGWIMIGFLPKK